MNRRTDPAEPPAAPRHAATIVLLRENNGAMEVLLTRRHEAISFMGGMWVFPGGTLSAADTTAASLALIADPEELHCERFSDIAGTPLPRERCMSLAVAACRETFEETGILLARTADGHHCGEELLARLHEQRRAIVSQPELFATLLQQERLQLDIGAMVYWAHWITPSLVPKRFDTRFFLARLPAGQNVSLDATETVEMRWMTPVSLLGAARDGTMTVSQPTLYNLMELDSCLRQHVSLDTLLDGATRRDIAPVLPKIVKREFRMIVMPWDSEYHNFPGLGVSSCIGYSASLQGLPSRVVSDR